MSVPNGCPSPPCQSGAAHWHLMPYSIPFHLRVVIFWTSRGCVVRVGTWAESERVSNNPDCACYMLPLLCVDDVHMPCSTCFPCCSCSDSAAPGLGVFAFHNFFDMNFSAIYNFLGKFNISHCPHQSAPTRERKLNITMTPKASGIEFDYLAWGLGWRRCQWHRI